MSVNEKKAKVLIIYYSFSGQINGLINHLISGLKESGVTVVTEKLRPVKALRFPVGNIPATIKMMLMTFLRMRVDIKDLDEQCFEDYNLILLAGPTWSYNPSGPVLSLLDRYGSKLFKKQKVIPVISCRGYWRMHRLGLKLKLKSSGAIIPNHIVFTHPCKEPWRTIGVFLKIAGKAPERSKFLGNRYARFGHSRKQHLEAENFGVMIGSALNKEEDLTQLDFHTGIAVAKNQDCS